MDIKSLGLKELLFIFFNIKAYNNNNHVVMTPKDIPANYFGTDSSIHSAKKHKIFITPPFTKKTLPKQIKALNNYYNFGKETFKSKKSSKRKIQIKFNNPDHLTLSQLLNITYKDICKKLLTTSTNRFSALFAINTFGFRGSFDYNRNFFTIDMHPSRIRSHKYITHLEHLLILTNFSSQLNLNFRELQHEEVLGKKYRATQFRINLRFFNDNYLHLLKFVNPYRYHQFKVNARLILRKPVVKNDNSWALDRLKFYHNNILKKNHIDKSDIRQLREQLNFDKEPSKNKHQKRSNSAKVFVRITEPERCASCQHIFKRSVRTFPLRGTHKKYWYFEIHHVISHANDNINTEMPSNLVKLCPACHRALTPRRADKSYQLKIINNIFHNEPSSKKYVQAVQRSLNNNEDPIIFTYKHLK